jgi:tetratricopeptide (TPR) repeat protein
MLNFNSQINNKMKNIFRFILLISLSFTACNDDFLEYKPDNAFTAEDRIANKADLVTYLNGMYDALSYSSTFGGQFALISELMSDGVDMSRSDNGDWQAHYSRTTDIFLGTTRTMMETAFKAIGRANNVLLNMPRITDLTDEERKRIEGECKFVRGMVHFEVVRFFGQPFGYSADNSQLGIAPRLSYGTEVVNRATVGEVYQIAIKDLKEAASMLPGTNGNYATSWAAKAMLAKIYFQMNDFQNAYAYADDVIENGGFAMDTDFNTKYRSGNEASKEIIFSLVTSNINFDNANGGFRDYFRVNISDNTVGVYSSKDIFTAANSNDDLRGKSWFKDASGAYICTKFDVDKAYNNPLIHLTEIKLIRAESAAELGQNLAKATDDLNEIKVRAGVPELTTPPAVTIINESRRERYIELYFENNRLHELKREAIKDNPNLLIRGVIWNCPGMVCQLPDSELKGNPDMLPNPQGGCN